MKFVQQLFSNIRKMKRCNFLILAVLFFFSASSYSQNYDDCFSQNIDMYKAIGSCKSLLKDKTKSNSDLSRVALRIGLLMQILESGSADEIIGYFLIAAEKGNTLGYSLIGSLYRTGYKELKIDYEKAKYYYYMDTHGYAEKMRGLAEMHLNGTGFELSVDNAIKLFTYATELDAEDSSTRIRLCEINSTDKYGKLNLVIAYFWCSNAVQAEDFSQLKSYYEKKKMDIYSRMSKIEREDSVRLIEKCSREKITSLCF
jgi:TPR repeat protein